MCKVVQDLNTGYLILCEDLQRQRSQPHQQKPILVKSESWDLGEEKENPLYNIQTFSQFIPHKEPKDQTLQEETKNHVSDLERETWRAEKQQTNQSFID